MVSNGREDATRNDKTQQAKRVLNENKFSLDAWAVLIQEAKEKSLNEARDFYESLIAQFPSCAKFWKIYIEAEIKEKNYDQAEQLFQKCLIKILNVDLWKCYLSYVRETKGNLTQFREKNIFERISMIQAYEFALDKIGTDVYSFSIWNDYINFLKKCEVSQNFDENKKNAMIRKVYQRVISIPISNVETLWKEYNAFETKVNPNSAKQILDERSQNYLKAKRVARDLETLTRLIDRNAPSTPITNPQTIEQIKQVAAWRKLIVWERSNPLQIEEFLLHARRVVLAYEQSLLCLAFHVDLWYEACSFLEQSSRTLFEKGDNVHGKRFLDEAATLYERAIQYSMRSSVLIHLAYADFEESRSNIEKSRSIYNRLLDMKQANIKDATLAYVQAMRFERRVDGMNAARLMFKRASEDIRTSHQIYIAAAWMEYFCAKDNRAAFNIFNWGLKKFGQHLDYLLAYIDYMTHLNEDHNARVLFERILSVDSSINKTLQPPVWNEFLKFESLVGDLQSIKNVEKRRLSLHADLQNLEGRGTLLLINRFKFLDLLPCSTDELQLFGYEEDPKDLRKSQWSFVENSSTNCVALLEKANRERRARLPRPDIKYMMPFRPTPHPSIRTLCTDDNTFPLPDTAGFLMKILPPARTFDGPYVMIDEFIDRLSRVIIPQTFETKPFHVHGEITHDIKKATMINNQLAKTAGLDDSDDDEPLNSRPTRDIYRQRQQKRLKLGNSNGNASQMMSN